MMTSICFVSKESLKEDELTICDVCNCRTSRHKTATEIAEFERLRIQANAETERLQANAETERLRIQANAETERLQAETERLRIQADVKKTIINARWRTGLTGKKSP